MNKQAAVNILDTFGKNLQKKPYFNFNLRYLFFKLKQLKYT
jgi:hypothetical protein